MAATAAPAARSHSTVYVSMYGKAAAADASCASAAYKSIGAAVSAVARGGTVVVCGGTYHEGVTVTKPLSLLGRPYTVIDAVGKINGILVRAPYVTVSHFTVTNATGEGILVRSADYATIEGNVVTHNDLGGWPVHPVPNTYAQCQTVGTGAGAIPGDCGEGIHLMGSSYSTVQDNVSTGNLGGILLSDETGPAAYNHIAGNMAARNLFECGITVVGHNPNAAPGGVPAPRVAGVYSNAIEGNHISGNGTKGNGAGVVLATGMRGGVRQHRRGQLDQRKRNVGRHRAQPRPRPVPQRQRDHAQRDRGQQPRRRLRLRPARGQADDRRARRDGRPAVHHGLRQRDRA
jgi:parallel beta-helix repeat protein